MSVIKKRALGRGLSALLSEDHQINSAADDGAENLVGSILEIPLDSIVVNPGQPRTYFDQVALEELAQSIKTLGVIQPITVRKQGDKFELISGERRFRASKLVGLESIPVFIRIANDQEMLEMALVENIQRKDLDAIEIALSYQRMIDEINLTQEQMSNRVGKDRSTITNYLRLLKLDPIVQTGIRDSMISMGHGRALIALDDTDVQLEIYEQILRNNLSVRQTESLIQSLKENKDNKQKEKPILPNALKKGLKELSDLLDTKVEITRAKNGKGKIILTFTSDEDFQRIQNIIQ